MRKNVDNRGIIALISVLVISAVVLMITISVGWQSTSELQMAWWTNQSEQSLSIADSCIEEGLNKLRLNWQDYSGSLNIGEDWCIINISTTAEQAVMTASAIVGESNRRLSVIVDRNQNIISWQEN